MSYKLARDRSGDVTTMAVLGALARGPAHGYEVQRILKSWHMDWWADIQSGAVYICLRKLERAGFIAVTATGSEGNRPQRRVYRITRAGLEEFRALLRHGWSGITRFSRPIDLALSFYDDLGRDEVLELLGERLAQLRALREVFHPRHMPPLTGAQGAVVEDLRDHERRLIAAEIAWTQRLLDRLGSEDYPAGYARSTVEPG